jgi:hypothetical protein
VLRASKTMAKRLISHPKVTVKKLSMFGCRSFFIRCLSSQLNPLLDYLYFEFKLHEIKKKLPNVGIERRREANKQ